MDLDGIRTLYSFNRWANGRFLDAIRPLDAAEVARPLGASYGSLHGTLVHVLWGEWVWLRRWRGESPQRVFAAEDFADVAAIEGRWRELERDRQDLLAGLTEERLRAPITYLSLRGERWTYPLVHMMQHVVNHSSYHRGQLAVLLRQLGHVPPATDFLMYFDEGGR